MKEVLSNILDSISLLERNGIEVKSLTISDNSFFYLATECNSPSLQTIRLATPSGITTILPENVGNR